VATEQATIDDTSVGATPRHPILNQGTAFTHKQWDGSEQQNLKGVLTVMAKKRIADLLVDTLMGAGVKRIYGLATLPKPTCSDEREPEMSDAGVLDHVENLGGRSRIRAATH
jgi:hypothetical protein